MGFVPGRENESSAREEPRISENTTLAPNFPFSEEGGETIGKPHDTVHLRGRVPVRKIRRALFSSKIYALTISFSSRS